MTSVDQFYIKSIVLQDFKNRNSVETGGLHDNGGNAVSEQSVRHSNQIVGEAFNLPHWLRARPFRNRHKMTPGINVDSGGMKVDVLQVFGGDSSSCLLISMIFPYSLPSPPPSWVDRHNRKGEQSI
jgi:hypothetical protein